MKFALVLTACIKPSEINKQNHSIVRSDVSVRLEDYKNALKFWLCYDSHLITSIIFVENSGYPLNELKDIAGKSNKYKRNIEFLQIESSAIPKGLHYGYSELEMIDYAYLNSQYIKECDFFIKTTGRLYFPKLNKLLESCKSNTLFISDCRDFALFKFEKHYILTMLLIINNDFYNKVLLNAKERMVPNQTDHFETLYYNILKPMSNSNPRNIIIRWPYNIEPVGFGAHWNVSYNSFQNRIESFVRGMVRMILPNLKV